MIYKILQKNKQIFLKYNKFRKKIFHELSQRDSEYILYLLPWLLSINDPKCPGYLAPLKKVFRIYKIEYNEEIRKREPIFKKMFNIKLKSRLLIPVPSSHIIDGLYTIGSLGTIGQTSSSDCDIWICYNKNNFNKQLWQLLDQKINLIKDWLDVQLKIPVYFFISDINDIKHGCFGSLDEESSGSMQRHILKEEFYRTCIVITGKIPLWWVCYDKKMQIDYNQALESIENNRKSNLGFEDDFVDLGNLYSVKQNEYLGAALWQLNKSLTKPLKSILKMALLKMQFESPDKRMIIHTFREVVLSGKSHKILYDPMIFTIISIFMYYSNQDKILSLLKNCFYLRCEIKNAYLKNNIKSELALELFKFYPIAKQEQKILSNFNNWTFNKQLKLGKEIFQFLFQIYNDIAADNIEKRNRFDQQDLKIIGRKLASCYQKKQDKVRLLPNPYGKLNLSTMTIILDNDIWRVFSGSNKNAKPLISHKDIIDIITFLVWNDLFVTSMIRMTPNPSRVTLQEIINLGTKIKNFLGSCDIWSIEYTNYLKDAYITKLLIIVSFEQHPWEKDIDDLSIVYKNSWGEIFVKKFQSHYQLKGFLKKSNAKIPNIEINYYLQRNSSYYSKIIERTKKIILNSTQEFETLKNLF